MSYINEEAAQRAGERISFSFGENWKRFLTGLSEPVIESAEASFRSFTKLTSLQGLTFLDLGCGSGLSSLVAARFGADRILSIDVDPHSIEATTTLRRQAGIPEDRWKILRGSVLDREFLESLGRFSFVHSWGVLHHTGAMWESVANVAEQNVAPDGRLFIALYNKHRTSQTWLRIKRRCNRWPRTFQPLIKTAYVTLIFSKILLRFKSPFAFVKNYNLQRGMSYFRDVDDWLGGLPYEFCSPGEAVDFLADRQFVLERLQTVDSCGCNEFLFRRNSVN